MRGARQRLRYPECRRVFSEFADAADRTLQENLDALGKSGADYLGTILFADATGLTPCKEGALAFTTVMVNGGRRGLEIEIAPGDIMRLLEASAAKLA